MSIIIYPVLFNTTDINNLTGVQVTAIDPYASPKRAVTTYPIAEADKEVTTSVRYRSRRIVLRCSISRPNKALMEQSLDELENIFRPREKVLELDVGGARRQFTATMTLFSVFDVAGGFCRVDIELTCADPFGWDRGYTLLNNTSGVTDRTQNYTFNVSGNATQLPRITITYSSITSAANTTVMITDNNRGSTISVLRTWTAGDVLVIDSVTGSVTVNGVDTTYSGGFPEFEPGSNTIFYDDEFTARNFTIKIEYRRRYA